MIGMFWNQSSSRRLPPPANIEALKIVSFFWPSPKHGVVCRKKWLTVLFDQIRLMKELGWLYGTFFFASTNHYKVKLWQVRSRLVYKGSLFGYPRSQKFVPYGIYKWNKSAVAFGFFCIHLEKSPQKIIQSNSKKFWEKLKKEKNKWSLEVWTLVFCQKARYTSGRRAYNPRHIIHMPGRLFIYNELGCKFRILTYLVLKRVPPPSSGSTISTIELYVLYRHVADIKSCGLYYPSFWKKCNPLHITVNEISGCDIQMDRLTVKS